MQWNDGYSELVTCFTNAIKNRDGGTHLTGFRQALTRTINAYANEYKLLKEAKGGLSGEGPSRDRWRAPLRQWFEAQAPGSTMRSGRDRAAFPLRNQKSKNPNGESAQALAL
jgi:hypothetical protein